MKLEPVKDSVWVDTENLSRERCNVKYGSSERHRVVTYMVNAVGNETAVAVGQEVRSEV